MSGGVDSSTTAALLVERGYRVIGLMMRLWSESDPAENGLHLDSSAGEHFASNRCCSPEAVADARGVCQALGIPFYLLNFEAEFKRHVVDFFVDGYARGTTPNPCLECNRRVKFGALLDKAQALGATALATGHYARVRSRAGRYELLRGVDANKDQSYALHLLDQEQLAHTLFPLGEFTKEETREMARRFGLRVADKHESQDLCFVADGDYRHFLQRRVPGLCRPGQIVDTRGTVLGQHAGLAFYTVGQRKGLGLALGEPLYVLALDTARNALIVGREDEMGRRELVAGPVHWIAGDPPAAEARVTAKIRYRAVECPATVAPADREPASGAQSVKVQFDRPLRDITPGQAVVFYEGEVCLGGGVIQ